MFYAEAYTQAKASGRKIRFGNNGTFVDPDSITSLPHAQAVSDQWEVSNEVAVTITPTVFAQRWEAARVNGGFRSVKAAADSDLFKELSRSLFGR